jgi:two-component system alkaline phosphatase synthesis response regulator PhoP
MLQNSYKILVIEPDDDWFSTISQTLERKDLKVIRTKSNKDTLKLVEKGNADLVIMEQSVEPVDGIEMTTEIRERSSKKQLPIVFFSETSDKYTQIAAFEAGADLFLWKGMKNRLFLAQICALLRRCYEMHDKSSALKQYGAILIDEEKVQVFKNKVPVDLSKKEFELLTLLTSKPGKVFKRPVILSRIWGDDIIVGNRNIDTHIKKLRKKIGKEYIKTSRGIGYKFEQP